MFQFSSVQWEGAGRGGESSSLAARPQAARFNVKLLFGLCFPYLWTWLGVQKQRGRCLSLGTGTLGRDRAELGHITGRF